VVRTSVFGCRRSLIYRRQMTPLWVKCPLWVSQLGQLSLPSLRGRQISSIYMDFGGKDHKNGRLGLRMAVCVQAKVCERGHGLRPRLNADPVLRTAPLVRHMRLAALYKGLNLYRSFSFCWA